MVAVIANITTNPIHFFILAPSFLFFYPSLNLTQLMAVGTELDSFLCVKRKKLRVDRDGGELLAG
jgi:hypothetical protein